MKKFLVFIFLVQISFTIAAHPGIGIVKDGKGNIYYTDLKQVWKISSDESKTVAVTGIHTHELYIDEQDNLYGEHLWYNGEAQNTWGHYAWCLKSDGELVKEIKPTQGFLTNYSFVRDTAGNMFWVERFTTSRIMKKSKSGEITKIAEDKFGFIGWLFAAKNGSLYFTENNKLHKLSADKRSDTYRIETLAANIGSRSADFTVLGHNYDSYGIWTDPEENIYLAMIDSKKVIRIAAGGKAETILGTNSLWTVCSGVFDDNGNMWILENSPTNEVRARKIAKQELAAGNIPTDPTKRSHWLITLFTGIAIVLLFFVARLILIKRRQKLHFAV
jgi:hypothetical protein